MQPFAAGNQAGLDGGKYENGVLKEHYHQGTSFDFEALMYSEIAPDITIILLTNNKNSKVLEIKDSIKTILAGKSDKMPEPASAQR